MTLGSHGSTFGGNPLVTSVANTVLDIIKKEHILANVNKISAIIEKLFKEIEHKKIKQIRIKGLMIGIELTENPAKLLQLALEHKILINITGNTIRMLPPLILTEQEAQIIVTKVIKLINSL